MGRIAAIGAALLVTAGFTTPGSGVAAPPRADAAVGLHVGGSSTAPTAPGRPPARPPSTAAPSRPPPRPAPEGRRAPSPAPARPARPATARSPPAPPPRSGSLARRATPTASCAAN
ncbi:hypothetical protein CKY47_30800 [Saccharothrix yanglingensis]|uniref:Secreted protein n=1 Tax=Saccharothrix yanglingensis TaxID=659496 RepID=A0ABU0X819_9PSEU|nr:hypothetical protein [Saccharothrix yanglingensis]